MLGLVSICSSCMARTIIRRSSITLRASPKEATKVRWVGADDALGGGAGGRPLHLSSNRGWSRGGLNAKDGLRREKMY